MERVLHESAAYIRDFYSKHGTRLNPSSRIGAAINRFVTDDNQPQPMILANDPDLKSALEGMKDLWQIDFILSQIAATDNRAFELIKKLPQDPILPEDSDNESTGRNAQAELFVYAICTKARLRPVLDEPDIKVNVAGKYFGIAVKRVRSREKLLNRVVEGAKQIQNAGLPGFIAVDCSSAFNPNNDITTTPMSMEKFDRLHNEAVRTMVRPFECSLRDRTRLRGVRSIVFHDHQIHLDERGVWRAKTGHLEFNTSQHSNQSREVERLLFWTSYALGLPNLASRPRRY